MGDSSDDHGNWQRIPEIEQVIRNSAVAEIAATLTGSDRAQLFHDHVMVKEPGTAKPTPWQPDGPYCFDEGRHTIRFWAPVDPETGASLRCVAGSHLWEKDVMPARWLKGETFFPDPERYMPVPDPGAEGAPVREWATEPGDAVAFLYNTLHGAPGHAAAALSQRLVGEDARYVERPGRTSPSSPGHGMQPGERLREDRFPVLRG